MSAWLELPLSDYEQHMVSAEVRQLQALSDLFAEAIDLRRPRSIALLGVAGGNGLERIDTAQTTRVLGIDLNPKYLAAVRKRFGWMSGLELHCVDLAKAKVDLEAVDLVHAALIFEHAGTGMCFENALVLAGREGAVSIVLQLPGNPGQNIGKSGIASLEGLAADFSLIDPVELGAALAKRGFHSVRETRVALPAGKGFWMGVFVQEQG